MGEKKIRVYGYRWVVLAVFMFINLIIQTLWISFAPITKEAALFYGVTDLKIGFLAMSFMIAYIPLSIPVSWVIDTFGFHIAVGIGAAIMGIFGVIRGFSGHSYTLVFWSTLGIAISQPFLLNAWTKVPAKWFPAGERATTVGLITLASLIGIAMGMVLSPILIGLSSIPNIQLIYGGVAAFSALLFIFIARENPPTPPCEEGMDERALMLDGLKHAIKVKSFQLYLLIYFIGMGIFNGITTWVENIIHTRGFGPSEAGTLGAVLLIGGILGAVIIPSFSDRHQKRKLYLLIGVVLSIPGLLGLTFASSFWLLIISSFFLGFFLVSVSPIGMQYAAEIANPTPEGTSNGLIQLFGQASVIFVFIMEAMKTKEGSFTIPLLFSAGLLVLSAVLVVFLEEKRLPEKK